MFDATYYLNSNLYKYSQQVNNIVGFISVNFNHAKNKFTKIKFKNVVLLVTEIIRWLVNQNHDKKTYYFCPSFNILKDHQKSN